MPDLAEIGHPIRIVSIRSSLLVGGLLASFATPLGCGSSDSAAPASAPSGSGGADTGGSAGAAAGGAGTGGDAGGTAGAAPMVGDYDAFATLASSSEGIASGKDATGAPALFVGSAGAVWRVAPDGTVAKHADVNAPLGMAMREDGDLLVCGKAPGAKATDPTPGVLWRVTPAGDASVFLAQSQYELPNMLAIGPGDEIVFSDSKANKVYRVSPDGAEATLLTDQITYPNGVAFAPDGSRVYVASWDSKRIFALVRNPDGTFGAPEVYADDVENVDGITPLANGDLLLVMSGAGVVKRAQDGTKTGIVGGKALGLPANGTFVGGPYGEGYFYVSNLLGKEVWRVFVAETGAALPVR